MPDTTYFFNQNDSICPFPQENDTVIVYSPEKTYLPPVPLKKNPDSFAHLIFTIVFFILFAIVRLRGKDFFGNLISVFINNKKTEVIPAEGISSNLTSFILSLLLSYSAITVIICFAVEISIVSTFSLYIFSALLSYHFFYLALVKILGWTFHSKNTAKEITINIWTYNILYGLFASPFAIALFFSRTFTGSIILKTALLILILFIILKIMRCSKILFLNRVSILYIILYLCAFEIIPLLVLYKFVVSSIGTT